MRETLQRFGFTLLAGAFTLVVAAVLAGCLPAKKHTVFHEKTSQAEIIPETQELTKVLTAVHPLAGTVTPTTKPPVSTRTPVKATWTPTPRAAYRAVPGVFDDGWITESLEEAGIDPYLIQKMVDHVYRGAHNGDSLVHADGSQKYQGIRAILIAKDGKLVFEEYFNGGGRKTKQDVQSVTKSITSLLVGLAIEYGDLRSVDVSAIPFMTDYMPVDYWNDDKSSITIGDLLTMRSGLDCDDANPKSKGQQWKMYKSIDWLAYFINLPVVQPPGSKWAYCSGGVIALGGILERATGMRISDYSAKVLFGPLGIDDFGWLRFRWGTSTSGALNLLPRDMAKIGQMMLDGGKWQGKQIVPEDWVRVSTSTQVELGSQSRQWFGRYGYLWWLGSLNAGGRELHPYAAWGLGGQFIIVFPDIDMVVIFCTDNQEKDSNMPLWILRRYILPAVFYTDSTQ